MGQRIVRVDYASLAGLLQLPAKIVAVSTHDQFSSDELLLKVESPEFTDVEPGCAIPEVSPVYGFGDDPPKFEGWHGYAKFSVVSSVTPPPVVIPPDMVSWWNDQAHRMFSDEVGVSIEPTPPPLPEPEPKKIKFREFL